MIRLDVTFFAHARDLAGTARATVDAPPGATASDLLRILEERHPALGALRIRIAVNNVYADGAQILRDGDGVAVIPPVSGG